MKMNVKIGGTKINKGSPPIPLFSRVQEKGVDGID